MANTIKPRDFLIQHKNSSTSVTKVSVFDLIEITELGITFPFEIVLDVTTFYNLLKKAVSDFNFRSQQSTAIHQLISTIYTQSIVNMLKP